MKAMRDYSQPHDPYGINREYTAQSADTDVANRPKKHDEVADVRGNTVAPVRSLPTQEEADAIKGAP